MSTRSWYIAAGIALIMVSVLGYAVQIVLFHRTSDTFFYLLQDVAFLPVEVLLVTLIINRLLQTRERRELQQKLNVIIGIFFNEMGNELLRYFSQFDVHLEQMRGIADIKQNWTNKDFARVKKRLERYDYTINCHCADLKDLKILLEQKRQFILGLLANPSLLENASFTRLLWAISHITQELELRPNLDDLPEADYNHLGTDMRRAYVTMVQEWLAYVERLKQSQPYVFSLLVRMNPFMENPSPVVEAEGDRGQGPGVGEGTDT